MALWDGCDGSRAGFRRDRTSPCASDPTVAPRCSGAACESVRWSDVLPVLAGSSHAPSTPRRPCWTCERGAGRPLLRPWIGSGHGFTPWDIPGVVDHDGRVEVDVACFGDTEVDLRTMEIRRSGEVQPVEPQVFDVLVHLIAHRDRVVTKEQLLDAVWGSRFVSESALTSRIKAARRAVGDNGRDQRIIRTHHGRGYRFVGELDHERRRPPPRRVERTGSCSNVTASSPSWPRCWSRRPPARPAKSCW